MENLDPLERAGAAYTHFGKGQSLVLSFLKYRSARR